MKSAATVAVEIIGVAEVAGVVVVSEAMDIEDAVVVLLVVLLVLQEASHHKLACRKQLYGITNCEILDALAHATCNNLILSFNLFLAAWHHTKAKWVKFFLHLTFAIAKTAQLSICMNLSCS